MLRLRPYQQAAIEAIYTYFETNSGHPVLIIPTAGGKSLIMAAFMEGVLKTWPDQRILVVTHVRELIAQNHAELVALWPEAPTGIYSAGLGRRDVDARILFAGIQSVHQRATEIAHCDLVLIDEAHLIPGSSSTMYRRFIHELSRINPKLKVIGFTATPFRLDSGMLHEGENALFTDIAYEVSVRSLIDQHYLCPLVAKHPKTQLSLTGVGTRGGEFIASQLQKAVDKDPITSAAIDEVVAYGRDRRSWLIFCAGVDHAKHVAQAVRAKGYTCATIFGDTKQDDRDRIIAAFKRGEIRALASMGVLTTGFNAPCVDLIAMLRPTKSAGLYVQMAGRGTRLASGKQDCLVLDFAGNIALHGPIDLVRPNRIGSGEGPAPTRVCPECESILPLSSMICPDCGHAFPEREIKIAPTASTSPILCTRKSQWASVSHVTYRRHVKDSSPPSMKVEYLCGLVTYSEWVCFEHSGYARSKAHSWWAQRGPNLPIPANVTEALSLAQKLIRPTEILLRPNGRYTEITQYRFGSCSSPKPDFVRSATANRDTTAGSTPISHSAIPVAKPAANGSAGACVKSSVTGAKA